MATTTKGAANKAAPKLTPAKMRAKLASVEEELRILKEDSAHCDMCDTTKKKDKFYYCSDPMIKSGVTRICKECAKKIACRVDKNGDLHEPTRESVMLALRYLDKPFIETLWTSSIQESENLVTGKIKTNVWTSYAKNMQMRQYVGFTYANSDMFKEKIIYDDEKTELQLVEEHAGQDTYDSFIKNKEDVIRLLSYDPFEEESIKDQPLLYSQLLGMLDQSEDANEDMMRTASSIDIVRGFNQNAKINDLLTKLMADPLSTEKNSATIKSLQDSRNKITSTITTLAAESCISLRNNKNAKKGENTWTGKTKKLKDMNLREGEVNGFDIDTCKAMRQVMDLSNESIMKQLHLDESEWSDMVAEQRAMIVELQDKLSNYIEISRILLRENLDIKDTLEEKNIDLGLDVVDLQKLYSCFSGIEPEESEE